MRTTARIISWLALAGSIIPAVLYLGGGMSLDAVKFWMLLSTIAWFLSVPVWMDRADKS
jgi:hypothetical protein